MLSIQPGTTLGNYTIVSILGVGGMGEVYKAYDPVLGRHIALKILLPQFVVIDELVDRFVQEAKSASALNHPHIITIHEIGRTELAIPDQPRRTIHYIAMELITGETLRTKVLSESFTIPLKLEILVQTAEGLAKAHAAGIVHRDLKPENIMVTEDGYAKVLDFGLAKLLQQKPFLADNEGKTAIRNQTREGVVMGTFGYMSPEQIGQKEVDPRSDIFSFGCILYQVFTKKNPFEADSMIDTMHAVVHAQPAPMIQEVPQLPPALDWIARRCLAKDPEERFQSMKEVALALRDVRREYESLPPTSQPFFIQSEKRHRTLVIVLITLLVAGVIGGAIALMRTRDTAATSAAFERMKIRRISGTSRTVTMAISPDGRYLVHAIDEGGRQSLWVKQLATGSDVLLVPASDVHYVDCLLSPDGEYVYYDSADNTHDVGTVWRVPVLGGTPQVIFRDLHNRISISRDGRFVAFAKQDRRAGETKLFIVGSDGNGMRIVSQRKLPDAFGAVSWSPDGKTIAASLGAFAREFEWKLVEINVSDGKARPIGTESWRVAESLAWLADNHAIIVNGKDVPTATRNQIWLVDLPSGSRHRLTNDLNDYEALSVSRDGRTLITLQKNQTSRIWVVTAGATRSIGDTPENIEGANGLTWTSDKKIVYASEGSDERDLWIVDPAGGKPRRLTDGHSDVLPSATWDGRYIVFVSKRGGSPNIWRVAADGGAPFRLTSGLQETSPSASPDGRWVLFHTNQTGVRTIWRVPIEGGAAAQLTRQASSWPSVSPDGRLFTCSWWDASSSKARIAVVSSGGGVPQTLLDIPVNSWMGGNNHLVRWTSGGKEIVYVLKKDGASNLWAQPLTGGPSRQLTQFTEGEIFYFDYSKDGADLACARGNVTSNVVLVTNFR
ncbi:MAG TPA: protein kinase [Thermoanaerobaculia bacterium]|nr:protein kinase [Thermoanaerobaculia bacterium]